MELTQKFAVVDDGEVNGTLATNTAYVALRKAIHDLPHPDQGGVKWIEYPVNGANIKSVMSRIRAALQTKHSGVRVKLVRRGNRVFIRPFWEGIDTPRANQRKLANQPESD